MGRGGSGCGGGTGRVEAGEIFELVWRGRFFQILVVGGIFSYLGVGERWMVARKIFFRLEGVRFENVFVSLKKIYGCSKI